MLNIVQSTAGRGLDLRVSQDKTLCLNFSSSLLLSISLYLCN